MFTNRFCGVSQSTRCASGGAPASPCGSSAQVLHKCGSRPRSSRPEGGGAKDGEALPPFMKVALLMYLTKLLVAELGVLRARLKTMPGSFACVRNDHGQGQGCVQLGLDERLLSFLQPVQSYGCLHFRAHLQAAVSQEGLRSLTLAGAHPRPVGAAVLARQRKCWTTSSSTDSASMSTQSAIGTARCWCIAES